MCKCLLFLCLVLVISCGPTINDTGSQKASSQVTKIIKTELFTLIGYTRENIHQTFGKSDRHEKSPELQSIGGSEDYLFDSYYDYGLVFEYDTNNIVKKIRVTHFIEKALPQAKIFGISLEDNLDKCTVKWGEHKDKRVPSWGGETAFYTWKHKGYNIVVQIWSTDQKHMEFYALDGKGEKRTVKKGDIRDIELSK